MNDRPPDASPAALRDLPVAELVVRARDGSRSSYGELVSRFDERLFNFLLRRTGNAADAEDIAQETFIRAWQKLDRYDPRWQFSTWLFTIGTRLAISRLRSERGRRAMTSSMTGSLAPSLTLDGVTADRAAPTDPDPAQIATDREQCDHLWALADRVLSETQRSALWLRYAEDLAPRTIARVLGKSQIGIRVMLFRARETLAEHCVDRSPDQPRSPAGPPRVRDAARALPKPVPGGVS